MSRRRPMKFVSGRSRVRNIRKTGDKQAFRPQGTTGFPTVRCLVPAVTNSYTPLSTTNTLISCHTSTQERRPLKALPRRGLTQQRPRNYQWERLDVEAQLKLATSAMERRIGGSLWAPTWHLNDTWQQRIRETRNIRYLVDELRVLVEKNMGDDPLYWFVVEESSSGRIHIHSGFRCTALELEQLENALKKRFCHGMEDKLWGNNKPVHVQPMWGPEGWAGYSSKNLRRFSRTVGVRKPYFISRPLKVLVKSDLNRRIARQSA